MKSNQALNKCHTYLLILKGRGLSNLDPMMLLSESITGAWWLALQLENLLAYRDVRRNEEEWQLGSEAFTTLLYCAGDNRRFSFCSCKYAHHELYNNNRYNYLFQSMRNSLNNLKNTDNLQNFNWTSTQTNKMITIILVEIMILKWVYNVKNTNIWCVSQTLI